MSDNELLLAISGMLDFKLDTMLVTKLDAMLDAKLAPIENRVKRIEVDLLENNVLPRLNTIESCYIDTFKRHKDSSDQMSAIADDVAMLKKQWQSILKNCKLFLESPNLFSSIYLF